MQTDLKIDQLQSKQAMKVGQYVLSNNIRLKPKFINQVGINTKQTWSRNTNVESSLLGLGTQLNKYPKLPPKAKEQKENVTRNQNLPEVDFVIGQSTKESKACNDKQYFDATKRFLPLFDPVQDPGKIIFDEITRGGQNSRIP
jgi:hypothetical protein